MHSSLSKAAVHFLALVLFLLSLSTIAVAAPTITSLSPTSGAVGASVTITGTNFGSTQGSSTVKFNGKAATATNWSATTIVAAVPSGATTGNVVVTVSGAPSNGKSFTVVAAPNISSLSPTSGAVGASVTVTGQTSAQHREPVRSSLTERRGHRPVGVQQALGCRSIRSYDGECRSTCQRGGQQWQELHCLGDAEYRKSISNVRSGRRIRDDYGNEFRSD